MHFIRPETVIIALGSCFLFPVYGAEDSLQSREEVSVVLTRKDNLPPESLHSATDPYFDISAARRDLGYTPSCTLWEATERSFLPR